MAIADVLEKKFFNIFRDTYFKQQFFMLQKNGTNFMMNEVISSCEIEYLKKVVISRSNPRLLGYSRE